MVKHDDRRAAAILEQLHLASDYIDRTLGETHLCCAPLAGHRSMASYVAQPPFQSEVGVQTLAPI
jgi:hypothetical protein